MSFITETARRRTFAIISHPDAGKTTLTEKLLLFGGAIQQAGAIKAKKTKKYTTSDWMELEKQRGVSVSTSVMCFEYDKYIINLLDTPGHADFSEDTYRTLTAVDSVILLIDSVKGVESRTKKLMEICRLRNIPVITFINKLDREGRDPFELLDDIEQSLQVVAIPLTWPVGMGKTFRGVYNIAEKSFLAFTAGKESKRDDFTVYHEIKDIPTLDEFQRPKLEDDLNMINGALGEFKLADYLGGHLTPVFFGSAINNFGVMDLLHHIISLAPAPRPRPAAERQIEPAEDKMTGIVFKIHANMDPKHRDRIAFMRICSGIFTRGMKMFQVRTGKEIKVSTPMTFMAQDRSVTEEAYPGDIIGIHDTGTIKVGDTFTEGELLNFVGIPSFAPEVFRRVLNRNPLKTKQLQKGLQQLSEEGAVQLFKDLDNQLILGAVGELQFDVVQFRLENEYQAQCAYEPMDTACAYWLTAETDKDLADFMHKRSSHVAYDTEGHPVYLFKSHWEVTHLQELFPKIKFFRTSERSAKDRV